GNVAVSEAKPQVEVASETLVTVEPEVLALHTTFNYNVKKAGIFSTDIDLPAGFTHFEATGDEIDSALPQKVNGRDVLQIKFRARRLGPFTFTVTADANRDKPDAALTVPVFNIPGAERHEAKVGVAIHVSLKANTTERGDLREEDIRGLQDLPIKDA